MSFAGSIFYTLHAAGILVSASEVSRKSCCATSQQSLNGEWKTLVLSSWGPRGRIGIECKVRGFDVNVKTISL